MMQVQVEIVLTGEQPHVNIHQLARKDATKDERGLAQAIQDLLMATIQHVHEDVTGESVDVTHIVEPEVERLRGVLRQIAAMDDAEGDSYERLCDAAHMAREALGDGQ
jgi:hypothetical protein